NEPLKVEIKNISFAYPGKEQNVLKNISFEFQAGKSYCLTGKNGSGKSTLLHLIAGLYQPQQGNVVINNYPIANYNINKLYRSFGNGLSEEKIFEGTLFENITLGRSGINQEQVDHILKSLFLNNYVQSLTRGLDTPIETSGHTLSESVIQKILIARSVVHQPKLVLLENHIDSIEENEKRAIIEFLTDKTNNWTLIAISNDNYFLGKVDHVINMQAGEILKK
ncbi:MAG: ATP-binding cassette domain-containing protein, partial [Bacteroidia bacterium]|nr:ATP-binding cassette domain-containing protein [Bacteroidia bacterium]